MGKQKTDEEFKKEFYDKFPNSSVNIIGNYINARTKIECKCKKCNLEWNTIPDNLLKNTGCPKCAKTKYNTESFKEKYYKKYPETNVLIMGEYIRNDIKIKCKCKKCGWEWSTRPNVLDSGSGCPKCAGTFRYATESFKKTYYKRFPNSNIMIVGIAVVKLILTIAKCFVKDVIEENQGNKKALTWRFFLWGKINFLDLGLSKTIKNHLDKISP